MPTKLGILYRELGYDSITRMLEYAATESVVPGICIAPGCNGIDSEVEPDCEDGYCDECGNQTIQSCLVIGGVI